MALASDARAGTRVELGWMHFIDTGLLPRYYAILQKYVRLYSRHFIEPLIPNIKAKCEDCGQGLHFIEHRHDISGLARATCSPIYGSWQSFFGAASTAWTQSLFKQQKPCAHGKQQ